MNGSGSKLASNILKMLKKKTPNFQILKNPVAVNVLTNPIREKRFFKTYSYVLSGHKNQVWSQKKFQPLAG